MIDVSRVLETVVTLKHLTTRPWTLAQGYFMIQTCFKYQTGSKLGYYIDIFISLIDIFDDVKFDANFDVDLSINPCRFSDYDANSWVDPGN